jgi:hypothetical protein
MSDRIVLRRVFAVDSNTGLTMDPGNVLLTNTIGGTTWTPMLLALSTTGGPIIGNLPSTISSFSTLTYANNISIDYISTTYLAAICSLGAILDSKTATIFTAGLGTLGYVSVATLDARMSTLQSDPSTVSTMAPSLSTLGFINISSLSSFAGGQTMSSMSTTAGLGSIGYVSTLSLISTVAGLGSIGYISSLAFQSTVEGLGTSGYLSSPAITNLGTIGYISSASLTSSIIGLGSSRYVSTGHLVSTTEGLTTMRTNIRFDNVTTISIIGGANINNFANVGNLIYVSTFFQSSIAYDGAQPGVKIQGRIIDPSVPVNMDFSTALIKMDSFSSFIDAKSRVTIEVYPTIAFSKLATGATDVAILPISTLLKYGNTIIDKSVTTNYLYAGNTRTLSETSLDGNLIYIDASNIFNQPIRLSIPQGTFTSIAGNTRVDNYNLPYTLYHYMPNSVNEGGFRNALHSRDITPYFGSTGSIFVTVQNSV